MILTNEFIDIHYLSKSFGNHWGNDNKKTSLQICFAFWLLYYFFSHISCCKTCNCNEKYVGRRKGSLVQCNSSEFQFVNPLFQQWMVLYTIYFLSSFSPICTTFYIGWCFIYFPNMFLEWSMLHPCFFLP